MKMHIHRSKGRTIAIIGAVAAVLAASAGAGAVLMMDPIDEYAPIAATTPDLGAVEPPASVSQRLDASATLLAGIHAEVAAMVTVSPDLDDPTASAVDARLLLLLAGIEELEDIVVDEDVHIGVAQLPETEADAVVAQIEAAVQEIEAIVGDLGVAVPTIDGIDLDDADLEGALAQVHVIVADLEGQLATLGLPPLDVTDCLAAIIC